MQILPPIPPDRRPPVQPFTPVPRKSPRHDGWTPERQRDFIAALAETGSVTAAARRVGLSPATAYALRHFAGAEEFAAAWDAALDHGVRQLSDIAIDRALNGVPVPVFWRGEQVGERRAFNDQLLMLVLRHRLPGEDGGTLLSPPRSRAQIEQEAAENCPKCKQRALEDAEAAAQAERDIQAFPSKCLLDVFNLYRKKVMMERRYRLSGRVIAADFTVRQLTHIELMITLGGRSADLIDMWTTTDGKTARVDNEIFADPISEILEDMRKQVWAREDGGLDRPALPNHQRKLPPTHGPCPGDTLAERRTARLRAEARIAEAQAEWEAAWSEETWERWKAGRASPGEQA